MLHVGFASADITPDPGMAMPGSFLKRAGKGVRDPLCAAACVVYDGNEAVALVGVDALAINRPTVEAARRRIHATTRIPPGHVLIGASHTHCGGPVADALGNLADPVYLERLTAGVADAVTRAWQSLHAAELRIGTGAEPSILFNRRFRMRNGREITHPGKPGTPHHHDIVAPAGPVDPSVGVLAARALSGQILGVVVNYACHTTVVGGDLFTPDYVAYLRRHLRAHLGVEVPVVFLLGACGDVTQVDNFSTARDFGPEHANYMGLKLAGEAARLLDRGPWQSEATVGAAVEPVSLAIRSDIDPDAERPPYGLGCDMTKDRIIEAVYARERELVAEEQRRSPMLRAEVQALRVGPLGITANGSEFFAEYGLSLKAASPFRPTWVVTLANEWIGYVPTAQAFVGGGYEPRTARCSKLCPDAGQRLLEASLRALGRLGRNSDESVSALLPVRG